MKRSIKVPGREEQLVRDVQTIKEMLLKVDKKHLVESWSYFIWGIVCVAGGIIHFVTEYWFGLRDIDLFLKVWLPLMCIGGIAETVGFVRKMAKESLPLLTATAKKLFFSFGLILVVFTVMVIIFLRVGLGKDIPVLVTSFVGICFIGYGLISYPPLLIQAAVQIFTGLALFVLEVPVPFSVLVIGVVIGGSFIWAGILARKSEAA